MAERIFLGGVLTSENKKLRGRTGLGGLRPHLAIEHLTKEGLYRKRDELLRVYGEVYAERLSDPFFSIDRYWERLEAYAARDGFSITVGTIENDPIGYALGFTLPARSG